ncbi:MAG: hypothetical protein QM642_05875 [Edaphocola sp.]
MPENNKSLFGGLKKLIFKDTPNEAPPAQAAPEAPAPQAVAIEAPLPSADAESIAKRAFEMLESINQPGIDFMEVWNAAEENGGVNAANLRMAFTALRHADKNLSKERIIETGNYYKTTLQKALDDDIAKKRTELQRINEQKQQTRSTLSQTVEDTKKKIAGLQQLLVEKTNELNELDNTSEPKLKALNQRITLGQQAIGDVLRKMNDTLTIIQNDL